MSLLVDLGARGRTGLVAVRRRWAVCSAVMFLGAGVVACSNDGGSAAATASATEAGAAATAPASASNTPDASPTPSVLPSLSPELQALRDEALAEPKPERYEGMDEYSTEGAMLSAAYFLNLFRYAYVSGDLSDWQSMSEEGCVFCDDVVTNVTDIHSSGGWVSPWEEHLEIVSVSRSNDDSTIYKVDIHGESGPSAEYAGDGTITASVTEVIEQDISLEVRWNGEEWRVVEGNPQ